MLNVTLLGGASFSIDGAVIKSDLGPAGRLLACYLFQFIGKAHRREQLADLFWSELDQEKARSALNTAMWRIRKLLDLAAKDGHRSLVTVAGNILLEPSSFVEVDTHVLQNASKKATSRSKSPNLTETDESEVAAVIDAYGGPFMDGDDGDWVLQERERLHSLFVRSSLELMRAAARRGQHECAIEYGRRILAADPLREAVQRDLMLLLVANGQRANAIQAYHHLRSVLRSELRVDPMPDTDHLYHKIISGEIFACLDSYTSAQFGLPDH